MKNRLIRIIGTIDEASFKQFSEELAELENSDRESSIMIELSSGGGVAYDALAFSGRMRNSPCNLVVYVYGVVASAAVLILASGDLRYMAKESWVMVHEDSDKLKGNVVDLERESRHLRRMENQWCSLLEGLTRADKNTWSSLHKETTYLCAKECLDLGLVDGLI